MYLKAASAPSVVAPLPMHKLVESHAQNVAPWVIVDPGATQLFRSASVPSSTVSDRDTSSHKTCFSVCRGALFCGCQQFVNRHMPQLRIFTTSSRFCNTTWWSASLAWSLLALCSLTCLPLPLVVVCALGSPLNQSNYLKVAER